MQLRKTGNALLGIVLLSTCTFAQPRTLCAQNRSVAIATTAPKSEITLGAHGEAPVKEAAQMGQNSQHEAPLVEKYLENGTIQAGETVLQKELTEHSNNDDLRFGLGTIQFLRAVEKLAQDLYRYGERNSVTTGLEFIPIVNMPLPSNPNPQTLTYTELQKIIKSFLLNLTKAEATLAQITDPDVKLPLHFGLIRLDLNGDGRAEDDESLWKLYAKLDGHRNINVQNAKEFYINFDRGDVHWLRGYCHVFMALCEVFLAHDTRETFNCTAHLFFAKVQSPFPFLSKARHQHGRFDDLEILDLIALIHVIRWPLVEPERMAAALHHLEAVVAQSKESWKWILAETDDDREWLPNPRQTGVIPNVLVTNEMVDAWRNLMDQSGKVLAGELLIPFWRGDDCRGINVRKIFLEPRTFDLVLWVQGPAATPYLQQGVMTKAGTWGKLQRAFGENFPGFAIWFN